MRNHGLKSAFSANVFAQITLGLGQIFALPILVSGWGGQLYGFWLLTLGTISTGVFFDLGIAGVVSNKLLECIARKRLSYVAPLIKVALLTLIVSLVALAIVGLSLLGWFQEKASGVLNADDAAKFYLICLLYVAEVLLSNWVSAMVRGLGRNDISSWAGASMAIIEILFPAAAAFNGDGLLVASVGMTLSRSIGTFGLLLIMHAELSRIAWRQRVLRTRAKLLTALLHRAVMAFMVPLSTMGLLQVPVITLGATGNLTAVAAYSSARTLSRVIFQFALTLPRAIMPQLTHAWSARNPAQVESLARLAGAAFWIFAAPLFALFAFCGHFAYHVWSGGKLELNWFDFPILALAGALHLYWNIVIFQLLAVNLHARASYRLLSCLVGYACIAAVAERGGFASLDTILVGACIAEGVICILVGSCALAEEMPLPIVNIGQLVQIAHLSWKGLRCLKLGRKL